MTPDARVLYEGSEITGALLPEFAKAWVWRRCQLSQAVATMQLYVQLVWEWLTCNQAMLSLGTSGVYFAVKRRVLKQARKKRRTQLRHALPQRRQLMSVMLSAASCLDWAAKLTGLSNVPALIAAAQQADESAEPVWFLPYLSGEHTPHR